MTNKRIRKRCLQKLFKRNRYVDKMSEINPGRAVNAVWYSLRFRVHHFRETCPTFSLKRSFVLRLVVART